MSIEVIEDAVAVLVCGHRLVDGQHAVAVIILIERVDHPVIVCVSRVCQVCADLDAVIDAVTIRVTSGRIQANPSLVRVREAIPVAISDERARR